MPIGASGRTIFLITVSGIGAIRFSRGWGFCAPFRIDFGAAQFGARKTTTLRNYRGGRQRIFQKEDAVRGITLPWDYNVPIFYYIARDRAPFKGSCCRAAARFRATWRAISKTAA